MVKSDREQVTGTKLRTVIGDDGCGSMFKQLKWYITRNSKIFNIITGI
jgi:hypothetical protein